MALSENVSVYRLVKFRLLVGTNFFAAVSVGICLVVAPFYLINSEGGIGTFGKIAFVTNLIIMVISPICGVYIDRVSRKAAMILLRAIFILVLLTALSFYGREGYSTTALALYFLTGNLFLMINNVARLAFVQEIFEAEHYNRVNAFMEVEKHAATMFTGAVIVLLIKSWGLELILIANLAMIFLSTLTIAFIEYEGDYRGNAPQITIGKSMAEGFRYLLSRPVLTLFLVGSFGPYICVLLGNYLIPVVISKLLDAGIEEFAKYEIIFGFGSIICGLTLFKVLERFRYISVIVFSVILFTAVTFTQAFWPSLLTIVWFSLVSGYANSAIRVARFSWMMQVIENTVMGRVNTTVSSLVLGVKAAMTGVIASAVVFGGPNWGLWIIFCLSAISMIFVAASARHFRVGP
jgi:MFS family permease